MRRVNPRSVGDPIELEDVLARAELTEAEIDIFKAAQHRTLEARSRTMVRQVGRGSDEVFYVRSGVISKLTIKSAGKRQILGLFFPGEFMWPSDLAGSYGLEAIVDSSLLIFNKGDIKQLLARQPAIASFFFQLVHSSQAIIYEWLVSCGTRDSTERVAHLLCETAVRTQRGNTSQPFQNFLTQRHIAEITGQTSVNVNRVISDLERLGFLKREHGGVVVTDPLELSRLASFDPAYLPSPASDKPSTGYREDNLDTIFENGELVR